MQYAKAIVGIIGAGITAALGLIPSEGNLFIILTVAAACVTAAGVYLVPNAQPGITPTDPGDGEPSDPVPGEDIPAGTDDGQTLTETDATPVSADYQPRHSSGA
jgi:hypothetical protein